MDHRSHFPRNHEIIEIEESNPGEHYISNNYVKPESRREEKDRRSLASNAGPISSLEDDLSQLFEMFNRRVSSNGPSHSNQSGSSRKNSSKNPVKNGGSHSPGHGIYERVNLKQALRGLCLSQASEMAAMKRSMKSPRSSEAGKILTMYRNVVIDDSTSDYQDDGRGGMLEISLVPEEVTFDSFQNFPEKSPASDLWPSNRSSLAEGRTRPATLQNESDFDSRDSGNQLFMPEKPTHPMVSSFPLADGKSPHKGHSILARNSMITRSTGTGSQTSAEKLQKQNYLPQLAPSPPNAIIGVWEMAKSNMRENVKLPASVDSGSQTSYTDSSQLGKLASPTYSSRSSYGKNSSESARKMPVHKEIDAAVVRAGNQLRKLDLLHMEESFSSLCPGEHSKSGISENGECFSAGFSDQLSLTESLQNEKLTSPRLSRPSNSKVPLDLAKKMGQKSLTKVDVVHKEDLAPVCSPRRSDCGDKASDQCKSSLGSKKLVSKAAAIDCADLDTKEFDAAVHREKSKTAALNGSPKGKKASKTTRNAKHFVKPLIKTKNFVKRRSKKKMVSDNISKNMHSEFNNDLYSSPNPIVCPRCQCVVTDSWKDVNKESSISHQEAPVSSQESPKSHRESPKFREDSPISPFASLSGEVSSGNVISDFSTSGPRSDSLNKSKAVLVESSGNSKSSNKVEFTQSSKGSLGECSTSTSVSEESNLSRPSICDRPHMSKDVRWEAIRHIRLQHGNLDLRHFNLLKKLGCGDIGTVYLAELIGTNCLFAIKVMDNEFLARRKKISRAQTEKEILRMLDHPFLPTLYCQFTSDNLSCLVMEYCPGGDLHVLRQKQSGRCFTEQAARFYVAEVLLALEYLHMLGVVYRDLKPENILVREDGHIMLSDFDLSLRCAVSPTLLVSSSMSGNSRKVTRPCVDSHCVQPLCMEPSCQVTCFTPRLRTSSSKLKRMKSDVAAEMRPLLQLVAEPTSARSNSFVGTHEYLAPEIIKGEGHGSAVDWWTFGIFLYELLYGRTPFKGAGNEETLANVVLQSLKFPDSPLVSLQARDLISVLLVKEPENRLGTQRGAAEIKQHPFFDGLNWALIRCAVPPELPESRSLVMPKAGAHGPNKYKSSGSGSTEHLEFEVF